MNGNIRRAIGAARQNLQIQRDAVSAQVNKFNEQVAETPQQERIADTD